jgi:hypothetical protein
MAALITLHEQQKISGVAPSNTSIVIENMHIERNLQSRRKLKRTHTQTETDILELDYLVCSFPDCSNEAVGKALLKGNGKTYDLCANHLREVSLNRLNWKVFQ